MSNFSTIYLVRHAEAMGNVKRTLLSANDDILTETGRNQAKQLGQHLSSIQFHRIYSSHFPRALDTAKTVYNLSDAPLKAQFIIDQRLCERDYGDLEGISYKEGFKRIQDSNVPSAFHYDVPGGEKVYEVTARMIRFFNELCEDLDKSTESETVLVVSHSFALVTFLRELSSPSSKFKLSNWDPKKDLKMMGNATYMKLSVENFKDPSGETQLGVVTRNREIKVETHHETSHLKSLVNGQKSEGSFATFLKQNEEVSKNYEGCAQQ